VYFRPSEGIEEVVPRDKIAVMTTTDDLKKRYRQTLLRPLAKRKVSPANRRHLERAIVMMEREVIADVLAPKLAERNRAINKSIGKGAWKEPAYARSMIELADALLHSNRISDQEYVFIASSTSEAIHEERQFAGVYPELLDLDRKMDAIRQSHNLAPDEYWPIGRGPRKYRDLEAQYKQATDSRFVQTLKELGATALADLFMSDRKEFDRRRERGRRSMNHKNETSAALADVIVRYEQEARIAASSGAYACAVTMLGAAVEGLLLMRCLRSKKKSSEIASRLPRQQRPRDTSSPLKWTFETLIETCLAAGWLPKVETSSIEIYPEALAHSLRDMRNRIHPGRVALDHPWIELSERNFAHAEVIYSTLFATLSLGTYRRVIEDAVDSMSVDIAHEDGFRKLAPYIDMSD